MGAILAFGVELILVTLETLDNLESCDKISLATIALSLLLSSGWMLGNLYGVACEMLCALVEKSPLWIDAMSGWTL